MILKLKIYLLIKLAQLLNRQWSKVPTDVVLAQAIHETSEGGIAFNSNIFKENKNLFGMKKPSVRPTTAIGSNRGHATYKTVYDSIKDYFMRQEYFKLTHIEGEADYMHATIASGYAEDGVYLSKWNAILTQNLASFKNFKKIFAVLIIAIPFGSIYIMYLGYNYFTKKSVR